MKRILLSLLLSIVFLGSWFSLLFILEEFNIASDENIEVISIPIRFPKYLYIDVLQFKFPENEVKQAIIILFAILFDVFIYGFVFYFIIILLDKFRKKKSVDKINTPPEPPMFN